MEHAKIIHKALSIQEQEKSDQSKDIDFTLNDYLRLVAWTGRTLRVDKIGMIPSEIAPILERIGLNPDAWLTSVSHYNRYYFLALGAIDRIEVYTLAQNKSWHRGKRAVLRCYRLVMA